MTAINRGQGVALGERRGRRTADARMRWPESGGSCGASGSRRCVDRVVVRRFGAALVSWYKGAALAASRGARPASARPGPSAPSTTDPMNRGFYTILAAQFFSALADNALLFAAIALLKDCTRRTGRRRCCRFLRLLLHRARALRRSARGCPAEGPRDVHRQRGQDPRLPRHADRPASAAGLRPRRHRCGDVLARQVRHPHRVPAAPESWSGPTAGWKV